MPTQHRRIAVTVDPELEAALATGRGALDVASDAGLVRALALRGAEGLSPMNEVAREFVRRTGARPATRRITDIPMPEGPITTEATEALEWVRGDR